MSSYLENQELNQSLQDVGAQLVKSELCKKYGNIDIKHVNDMFSVLVCKINGRKAVMFLKTVMFPIDYEEAVEKLISDIVNDYVKGADIEILEKFDIYAMGLGAVQKYVDNDKDKGVFRIGGKYAGAFGSIRLIRKASEASLGYSLDNPLPVDSIACEYAMLKDVISDYGIVTRKNRVGSMLGSSGHMIDKWLIEVADFDGDIQYHYTIYLDPYSQDGENCLKRLYPESSFGEWTMPEGFRSVWFAES